MAYYDDYYTQPYDYMYDQYEPTPPPPADRDWIDPVPEVRKYLERIQQDCVQEEFKELKETWLYQMEVVIGSVVLQKDFMTSPIELKHLNAQVQFPTLDFLDVEIKESRNSGNSVRSSKPKVISSFVDLFQNIFETMFEDGHVIEAIEQDTPSDVVDEEEEEEEEYDTEETVEEADSQSKVQSIPSDVDVTVKVDRGKSVVLTMSGLEMIQSLQRHPVIVHVKVEQTTEDGAEDSAEVEAVVRLPEHFRQAILKSSRPTSTLPLSAMTTDYFPLLDSYGTQVGDIQLDLSITCLGSSVVNSLHAVGPEMYKYKNPLFLNLKKSSQIVPEVSSVFSPDPKDWKINFKSSKEILSTCKKEDGTEICSPIKCNWFKMAQEAVPEEEEVISVQPEKPDYFGLAMLGEHKRICKEVLEGERTPRKGLDKDKLELLESFLEEARRNATLSSVKSEPDDETNHSNISDK